LADHGLRARSIGNQRLGLRSGRNCRERIDRRPYWERNVDEIRATHCRSQIRLAVRNDSRRVSVIQHVRAIMSCDFDVREFLAQSERERTAD
jgi:hypothetical protein